jgi:hypothetical protein
MAATAAAPRTRRTWRGIIAAHIKQNPSYHGKPITREEQLEVTPTHLAAWLPRLRGLPLQLWHDDVRVGTIVNASIDADAKLMVDFQFEEGELGQFAQRQFGYGHFPELSLSHILNDSLDPVEVSLCEAGAREGCRVTEEVKPFIPDPLPPDPEPHADLPQQTNSSIKPSISSSSSSQSSPAAPSLPLPAASVVSASNPVPVLPDAKAAPKVSAMDAPSPAMFEQIAMNAITNGLQNSHGASKPFGPPSTGTAAQFAVLDNERALAQQTGRAPPALFGRDTAMDVEAPLPRSMQEELDQKQQQQQQPREQKQQQQSTQPLDSNPDLPLSDDQPTPSSETPQQSEQIVDLRHRLNGLISQNNRVSDMLARSNLSTEDRKMLSEHLAASQELAKEAGYRLKDALAARDAAEQKSGKIFSQSMQRFKRDKNMVVELMKILNERNGRKDLPVDMPDAAITPQLVSAAQTMHDVLAKERQEKEILAAKIAVMQEQHDKERAALLRQNQEQKIDQQKLDKLRSVTQWQDGPSAPSSSSSSWHSQPSSYQYGPSSSSSSTASYPRVNASRPYSSSFSAPSSSSSSGSRFSSSSSSSSSPAYDGWAQPSRPAPLYHPPALFVPEQSNMPDAARIYPSTFQHRVPELIVRASSEQGQEYNLREDRARYPSIHELFHAVKEEAAQRGMPLHDNELTEVPSEWVKGQQR